MESFLGGETMRKLFSGKSGLLESTLGKIILWVAAIAAILIIVGVVFKEKLVDLVNILIDKIL